MKSNLVKSNILKFYIADFFASFEFAAAIFVLYLISNDFSMTQVLILQSFFTVSIFLLEVPSGVFADLFGLKKTLIISQICVIIGFILYGLFSTFFTFMIAEFFIAMAWALNSGTDSAFIYNTLEQIKKDGNFKKVMGRIQSLSMISYGISAAIGGYLASLVGYRNLFFITAIFFTLSLLVMFSLVEPKIFRKVKDRNYFKHLKEGVSYAFKNQKIKRYVIYISVFGALMYMLFFLIQPYYEKGGLSLTLIGIGVSGYFFFNALGFYLTDYISRTFEDKDDLLIYMLFIISALFIILKFVNVYFGMIIIFTIMFFSSIKELIVDNEVNKHSAPSHRATILSVKNMGKSLVYTICGPILGYITDVFSLNTALLCIGITLMIFGVYITIMFKITKDNSDIEKII